MGWKVNIFCSSYGKGTWYLIHSKRVYNKGFWVYIRETPDSDFLLGFPFFRTFDIILSFSFHFLVLKNIFLRIKGIEYLPLITITIHTTLTPNTFLKSFGSSFLFLSHYKIYFFSTPSYHYTKKSFFYSIMKIKLNWRFCSTVWYTLTFIFINTLNCTRTSS